MIMIADLWLQFDVSSFKSVPHILNRISFSETEMDFQQVRAITAAVTTLSPETAVNSLS